MATTELIGLSDAKKRLALLWFPASGALFLLVMLQTAFGHYGDHWRDAWSWLLPTIVPSLSLMVAVFSMDLRGNSDTDRQVERFGFSLCFWISVFYFGTVALTILLGPMAEQFGTSSLDLMTESQLWLAPLQGIVSGVLGWFFVKPESAKKRRKAAAP